jgi:hypothetical protein
LRAKRNTVDLRPLFCFERSIPRESLTQRFAGRDSSKANLEDLGLVPLKGQPQPARIFRVV